MTINHLNLIVSDLAKAIDFFETYFTFSCQMVKGNVIAILKNKEEFTLVLMEDEDDSKYPKNFHIGFMLDSMDAVNELHQKLLNGKNEITQSPGKIRDSYGFYFYFDKLFIEAGCYLK